MYLQFVFALFFWLEQVAGCVDGELKFESDTRPIQICTGGQWGYICAKNDNQWSKKEAQVACQQMGNKSKNTDMTTNVQSSKKEYSVKYSHFKCNGLEQQVINCYHKISNNADECKKKDKYYYAATSCESTSGCKGGELSLNGKTPTICAFGQWHRLCGDTWTLDQAKVACRQLGRNPIGATNMTLDDKVPNDFIQFYCNGNEDSLRDCSVGNNYYCPSPAVVAGLTCGEWPDPPHNLSIQQVESSIQLYWKYSVNHKTNVTAFNISCESKTQQSKYWYTIESVHFNNTINASIIGLLPNTTYTCCVLAVTSYGESEPLCKNITTHKTTNQICYSVDTFTTIDIKTTVTTVTIMTTITPVTISQSCTINTMQTLSPNDTITSGEPVCTTPTTKTQTSTSGGPWIGGILIGMISGILVMVMVWVVVTLIGKKRKLKVNNSQRYHSNCTTSQDAALEGLSNPTYDGQVHQNNNQNVTELLEADADYSCAQTHQNIVYESVSGTGIEGPVTNQGSTVISGVYSYDEVNNVKIEGVYSLAEDEIETYSKLQRK